MENILLSSVFGLLTVELLEEIKEMNEILNSPRTSPEEHERLTREVEKKRRELKDILARY